MASMTNYLANALFSEVLRNTNYAPPATVYLALFTTATSDAGGGTEVTGGSYARKAITFGAPTNGLGSNDTLIEFTNMPAATVTHAALMDDPTAGNMLLHGALLAPKIVGAGDTLPFDPGDVDCTMG